MKQLKLLKEKVKSEFGGSLLLGKRRKRRPLSRKHPHHLIFKAENPLRLLRNTNRVKEIVYKYAMRFGIKVHEIAVQADHIHLVIKIPSRAFYVRWVRAVTAVLVMTIPGLKWNLRPWSRISEWGKAFVRLKNYVIRNQIVADFLLESHLTVDRRRQSILRLASA